MPKWRDRECTTCKQVELTASKSDVCISCYAKNKSLDASQKEKQIAEDYGYEVEGLPTINKFGKRVYKLIAPCCGESFSTVFGNLISGIKKNEQSGYSKLPCGACGPRHRMANALNGYMKNNARDYDLEVFNDYKMKVRRLSEVTLKNNLDKLNPNNLPRGLAGQEHANHLDHKMPIIECFKRGLSIEMAASIDNLQMLPWNENLSKGSKCIIINNES